MELYQLKDRLVKNKLDPLYIFTGEEIAVMDIYIKKIIEISGLKMVRADSLGSIFNKLQNQSIINKPNCYIIRDDKDYTQQEKIWDSLNIGSIQGNNIIILIYDKIDKRSRFYKHHNEIIVEFEKLGPEVLIRYIQKDIGLKGTDALGLVEMCDYNYNKIKLESDKLQRLADAKNIDIKQAYQIAVRDKLIYTEPKDVIFELVDCICQRRVRDSFDLYQELKMINENPLGLISLLYSNFKSMLIIQSIEPGANISQRSGLTPWQIKLAKEKGNNYSIIELVSIIKIIRETEKGIKTGLMESDKAIDYILVSIL